MILNEYGKIVYDEWIKSASIRSEITLDEFTIMPNHFHCIVGIKKCADDRTGYRPVAPTTPICPKKKSIGALMAGFKSFVTKKINILRNTHGKNVWQRDYYEHIIRNDDDLERVRKYILNNPMKWEREINNGKYFCTAN